MGFFDDIINGVNAWANLKKADAEQIKAKNQQSKVRKINRENRKLKKTLSKNNKLGIIGITVTILSVIMGIIFWYFPI
jgi:cell division protein FtsL